MTYIQQIDDPRLFTVNETGEQIEWEALKQRLEESCACEVYFVSKA